MTSYFEDTGAPSTAAPRRALGGLLVRKERWSLSLTAKLVLLLTVFLLGVVAVRVMYPFLAVTSRVSGEILVVEGWIPTYTLAQAAKEFKLERHQRVIVVRALYKTTSKYESGQFLADYIAETLITDGVPRERVQTVFLEADKRDRTYASAVAVKQWLKQNGLSIRALDVVTLGPHARRSRLLYQKAFGENVKVGVVALEDESYEPDHWWRYSFGLREVPSECAAYLDARLRFTLN